MTKNIQYANFPERLLARLVDFSIYHLLILIPFSKIAIINDAAYLLDNILTFTLYILTFAVIVIPFETLMVSKFRGTPGKLLMGLRIQKDQGDRLTLKEAFLRITLGHMVSGLFFSLGYLWIFKNEKRKCWHDIIQGTVVVKEVPYGFWIGLLIFFVFFLMNATIFLQEITGLVENSHFYEDLFNSFFTPKRSVPAMIIPGV